MSTADLDHLPIHGLDPALVLAQLVRLGFVRETRDEHLRVQSLAIVGETLLTDAVERAIAPFTAPAFAIERLPWRDGDDDDTWIDALGQCTPLIVAIADDNPRKLRSIARRCAARHVTWTLLRVNGTYAEAGPLFLPGQSPCVWCMSIRLLAASEEWDAELRYQHSRETGGSGVTPSPCPTVVQIAVALLVAEIHAFAKSRGACSIADAKWVAQVDPVHVQLTRVLRIPGCPICAIGQAALTPLVAEAIP